MLACLQAYLDRTAGEDLWCSNSCSSWTKNSFYIIRWQHRELDFSETLRNEMKGAGHGGTGLNSICRCTSGPLLGCLYGSFWQQSMHLACIHFYNSVNNFLWLQHGAQEKPCIHTTASSSSMLEWPDWLGHLEGKVWDLKRMGAKYRAPASIWFSPFPWEYSQWKQFYRCENNFPQAGRFWRVSWQAARSLEFSLHSRARTQLISWRFIFLGN